MTREELSTALDVPVSRETKARLDIYVAELERWQTRLNLVGARTLADIWTRHIVDSAQLTVLAEGETWLDMGSGAGLPGLIVAAFRDRDRVVLVECDTRKSAFLRHAAFAMGLAVEIVPSRIEAALPALGRIPHVVTARALCALPRLLAYAQPFLSQGAVGLFPKGRGYAEELTVAFESWTFDVEVLPSRTARDARILRVRNLVSGEPSVDQTRRA